MNLRAPRLCGPSFEASPGRVAGAARISFLPARGRSSAWSAASTSDSTSWPSPGSSPHEADRDLIVDPSLAQRDVSPPHPVGKTLPDDQRALPIGLHQTTASSSPP